MDVRNSCNLFYLTTEHHIENFGGQLPFAHSLVSGLNSGIFK